MADNQANKSNLIIATFVVIFFTKLKNKNDSKKIKPLMLMFITPTGL